MTLRRRSGSPGTSSPAIAHIDPEQQIRRAHTCRVLFEEPAEHPGGVSCRQLIQRSAKARPRIRRVNLATITTITARHTGTANRRAIGIAREVIAPGAGHRVDHDSQHEAGPRAPSRRAQVGTIWAQIAVVRGGRGRDQAGPPATGD